MAANAANAIRPDSKIAQDATAYGLGLTPEIYRLYRMGENLAHIIAYKNLKMNEIIKVYIAEIQEEVEHIVYRLQVDHPGLVGYILCPTQFPKTLENKIDLKIIFRGTDIFDYNCWLRNCTEAGGAGHESFHANKDTILTQIIQAFKHLKEQLTKLGIDLKQVKFSITIAGHSLGAADAQRLLFALKEAIAQNLGCELDININGVLPEERKELNDISKLRLFTFNSTGASIDDNQKAEAVSGWITSKKNEPNSKIKLETEINILYADGDGVQQTGDKHILYRASREQALVRFIKANNNQRGQHYIKAKETYGTILTLMRKTMGYRGLKNLAFMGAGSLLGMYLYDFNMLAGFFGLLGGTAIKIKDWYNMAKVIHSIGARLWNISYSLRPFFPR